MLLVVFLISKIGILVVVCLSCCLNFLMKVEWLKVLSVSGGCWGGVLCLSVFCMVDSSFCKVIGFLRKLNVLKWVVLIVVFIVLCFDIMMIGMLRCFLVCYFFKSEMLFIFGI